MTQAAQEQATGQAVNGAELARQVNAEVRTALERAQQELARREMAQAAQPAQPAPPPPPPGPGGTFRVEGKDGRVVEIGPGGVKVLPSQTAGTAQPPVTIAPQIPPEAVVISIAFFVMVAFILVGWPIARAVARRMDRATVAPSRGAAGDPERLVRIEQAIEAMAVEVERISENQRFVTKLLSEGRAPQEALPVRGGAESAAAERIAAERITGERIAGERIAGERGGAERDRT